MKISAWPPFTEITEHSKRVDYRSKVHTRTLPVPSRLQRGETVLPTAGILSTENQYRASIKRQTTKAWNIYFSNRYPNVLSKHVRDIIRVFVSVTKVNKELTLRINKCPTTARIKQVSSCIVDFCFSIDVKCGELQGDERNGKRFRET